MQNGVRCCSKCGRAMGYRLEPLPEVWRESWQCFVCDSVIAVDHPRFGSGGKDLKPQADKFENDSHVLSEAVEEKSAEAEAVIEPSAPVQMALDLGPAADNAAPVKRKRGRPRKNDTTE